MGGGLKNVDNTFMGWRYNKWWLEDPMSCTRMSKNKYRTDIRQGLSGSFR